MGNRSVGFLAAFSVAVLVAAACGPGNATGPGPVVAPTDPDASVLPATADAAVAEVPKKAEADAAAVATGAKLCGCSLCEPLFSDDACTADADCAPSAACHAEACVAKAKAPARPKNVACTQIMKCATVDANSCGCVQGKCALAPKAKP